MIFGGLEKSLNVFSSIRKPFIIYKDKFVFFIYFSLSIIIWTYDRGWTLKSNKNCIFNDVYFRNHFFVFIDAK